MLFFFSCGIVFCNTAFSSTNLKNEIEVTLYQLHLKLLSELSFALTQSLQQLLSTQEYSLVRDAEGFKCTVQYKLKKNDVVSIYGSQSTLLQYAFGKRLTVV